MLLERAPVAAVAGRARRIHTDQTGLCRSTVVPREQLPPQHHATTYTRAQGEQHHITEALRRTKPGFPHQAQLLSLARVTTPADLKPVGQRHVVPTRQVDTRATRAEASMGPGKPTPTSLAKRVGSNRSRHQSPSQHRHRRLRGGSTAPGAPPAVETASLIAATRSIPITCWLSDDGPSAVWGFKGSEAQKHLQLALPGSIAVHGSRQAVLGFN